MMRKPVLFFVLLILLAGSGYWYFGRAHPSKQTTLVLSGNVDIRDVSLGFRVGGRIEHMFYEEGDRVVSGAVLAVLDKKPFKESADLARAELAEAEAAYVYADKMYARRERLLSGGAVSQSKFDDALAQRDESKARRDAAEARLAQAETRLADTRLLAPAQGLILTRIREPGVVVDAGWPVYSLALDTPVWIRAYVDEPDLGFVYPGQAAKVYTDSGGSYSGQIGFISPQAEFTPKNVETTQLRTDLVFRLRIIVDTPDQGLRQGMPVTVKIAN